MANVYLEVAGYLRKLIDLGASSVNETGVAREYYAEGVVLLDGSGNVVSPGATAGTLTNNNAAPTTTNFGALTALANAAVPTWSEGKQVLLSVDLSGRQRSAGTLTNNAAAPGGDNLGTLSAVANAAVPAWTEGRQVALSTDLSGRLRAAGTLSNNNAAPGSGHIGTLGAVANAAIQTWTEGNAVALSTDLSGRLRIVGTLTNNNAAPATHVGALAAVANAAAPSWTEGNSVLGSVDLSGNTRVTLGTLISGEDQAANVMRVIAGGYTLTPAATLTRPANTTAYSAGDEVTDTGGAILTFSNCARASGGSGVIYGASISVSSNWATKPQLELWIFDTTSTPATDNAAFAPSDGVNDTCLGIISLSTTYIGDATASSGNFMMDSGQISLPFVTSGSANLFGRLVIRNAGQAGANSDTLKCRLRVGAD